MSEETNATEATPAEGATVAETTQQGAEPAEGGGTLAAKTDVPQPQPKPDDATKRFLALAKKERGIQQERERLKSQQAALEAERAEVQKIRDEHAAWQSKVQRGKADPLGFMQQELGLDYDQIAQIKMNGDQLTPEMVIKLAEAKADEKINELKQERQRDLEAQRAQLQEANQRTVQEFRNHVIQEVKAHPEQFELTTALGSEGLVLEVIEEDFRLNSGKPGWRLKNVQEAGALVEAYLEKQLEAATKTKKWQARSGVQPQDQQGGEQERPKGKASASERTLDNKLAATSAEAKRALTEKERRARAEAALEKLGFS